MALDKTTLKNSIETLLTSLYENTANLTTAQARTKFAGDLADAFEAFVKSGDGVYQVGTLKAGTTVVTAAPTTIVKIQ